MALQLNETRGELRARRLNVPVEIKIQIGVSLGQNSRRPINVIQMGLERDHLRNGKRFLQGFFDGPEAAV